MIKFLAFFTVPIVPFSFVTEYIFENCKSCRNFFFPVLVLLGLFFAGFGVGSVGLLVALLALFTSAIYTYKLFRVRDYEEWLFTYYVATVSLSWLSPGGMLFFITAFAIPLTVIHFLLYHLKRQGAKPEPESLKGIGSYLSGFSTILFIALVASLVIAPAYSLLLLSGVLRANILVAPLLIAEWIAWNWVGFKLFSPVFFGEYKGEKRYEDLDPAEAFPLVFLLLMTFILPLL
ncbi:MAG: hypothetical protein GXO04_00550 [Aquificae bacterium]|nr:hypothetical protein [Aquificota bacterium]